MYFNPAKAVRELGLPQTPARQALAGRGGMVPGEWICKKVNHQDPITKHQRIFNNQTFKFSGRYDAVHSGDWVLELLWGFGDWSLEF